MKFYHALVSNRLLFEGCQHTVAKCNRRAVNRTAFGGADVTKRVGGPPIAKPHH